MHSSDGREVEVKDPEGLLKSYKKNLKFMLSSLIIGFALFAASIVICIVLGLEADNIRAIFIFNVWLLFAVAVIVAVFKARRKGFVAQGALLVERWDKTTYHQANRFPRNCIELESYRYWLLREISFRAGDVTVWFDLRESEKKKLDEVLKEKPNLPEWPEKVFPGDMEEVRQKYEEQVKKILADHQTLILICKESHKDRSDDADEYHKNYRAWWNLAKDLGEFYGVNVLPTDDDGKPFEDWDKFRKYLKAKDDGRQSALPLVIPAESCGSGMGE